MAKVDPYSLSYSIGQMLAHAKGREEKQHTGFANTSANQKQAAEQAIIAALQERVFGSPFNNVGAPQRDPRVGQPMRMPLRSDSDYADPVRQIRQRYKADNVDSGGHAAMDAAYDEAWRLEDLVPEDPNPALGGAMLGEREAYDYFNRRDAKSPTINANAAIPPGMRDARLRNSDRLLAQYPGADEHAAEVKRSRDHAAAMDAASQNGQRGMREADYYELASKYPEHQQPGATVVGGGDLSYIKRQSAPQLFRGGVSAAISGLGAPMNESQMSALNNKLAEREAGIRAYEQQTGPRPGAPAGQADQIFANRTQNLMEGRGLIPDKRAEYLLQQRENEQTRNQALAAAQQYVQSQPNALMRLEDYRDPQGSFERRMQERAFGLAEQRESGAAADRAEALRMRGEGNNIQREELQARERMHKEGMTAQERREADQANRQREMFELEQRIADKRQLDSEGREDKAYGRRKSDDDTEFERRFRKEMELHNLKIKAEADKNLSPEDQAETELILNDVNMSMEDKRAHLAALRQKRSGAPTAPAGNAAASSTPMYPNMNEYLGTLGKEHKTVAAFMDAVDFAAGDSPAEHKKIEQYARQRFGDAEFNKWSSQKEYDFGWLRNSLGDRGYATKKQNIRRGKAGLSQNPIPESGFLNQAAGAAAALNPLTAPTALLLKALSR